MKKSFIAALTTFDLGIAAMPVCAEVPEIVFTLVPQPTFVGCLGELYGPTPTAQVIVQRGELNDTLILRAL